MLRRRQATAEHDWANQPEQPGRVVGLAGIITPAPGHGIGAAAIVHRKFCNTAKLSTNKWVFAGQVTE